MDFAVGEIFLLTDFVVLSIDKVAHFVARLVK